MMHTLLLIPGGENITVQGVRLPRHGDKEPSQPPKPLTGKSSLNRPNINITLVYSSNVNMLKNNNAQQLFWDTC